MIQEVLTLPNEHELARELARRFRLAVETALADNRHAALALTGGAGARFYQAMRYERIEWRDVALFWSDERAVPPDHPDSNYRAARDLLDHVDIPAVNVHRMPAEQADLDSVALQYERILPPRLDLIHIGMGADGHVCSLFPGHELLAERHRRVRAIEDAPKTPSRRLTLTIPAIHMAHAILLTVIGSEKAHAAHEVLENPRSTLPAALVVRGSVPTTILLDSLATTT